MNTLLYLWIEPLIMNHKRSNEKHYFNCIIKGDFTNTDKDDLDSIIEGEHMNDIMDFADIDSNWNYKVIAATLTNKKTCIKHADSPEDKVINKEISKIVANKKDVVLNANSVIVNDGGMINVQIPELKINEAINFPKIWASIEKNFIGKIKKGDKVILTDTHGNTIFEVMGGSFLNIALADLMIKDARTGALKGGVYVREDGSMDIGDIKRTFYLKIHTNKLLTKALFLKKSMMEITQQSLLNNSKTKQ